MKLTFPLILGILSAAGGFAAAQVNLLPQGSFENPSLNTGWADGFNLPNNEEFRVISENGQRWLRIENRDPTRQLDYVHAYVKVTPEIASLTVSARLRATNLKIGQEGWHTARVALIFKGGCPRIESRLRLVDEVGGTDRAQGSNATEHPAGSVPLHRSLRGRRPDGHASPGGTDPVGRRRAAVGHQPGLGPDEGRDG